MRYPTLLVLLTGLVLGGCDSGFEPPRPEAPDAPSVTAILQPHADRQRVLLTRVQAIDEGAPHGTGPLPLIQTAAVRVDDRPFLVRPEDSVNVRARRLQDTYNYYSDSLEVDPGATYRLTVVHEDDTVRGRTTVPGRFWGDAEGLRLFWHESEGAARYRVTVRAAEGNPGDFHEQALTADTSLTIQPGEAFEAGEHFVRVEALSENLAAFLLGTSSRSGLEGAYGVFGGMTVIAGTVTLGREDSTRSKEAVRRLRASVGGVVSGNS